MQLRTALYDTTYVISEKKASEQQPLVAPKSQRIHRSISVALDYVYYCNNNQKLTNEQRVDYLSQKLHLNIQLVGIAKMPTYIADPAARERFYVFAEALQTRRKTVSTLPRYR